MDDHRLDGKIALVSGASRGLGRAVARELAAAGAHVVATGRSTRTAPTQTDVDDLTLERTVELVTESGGSALRGHLEHGHEAVRFGVRQRPQQHAVNDAEYSGGRANPQGESQDRDRGETGILAELAKRVAAVGDEGLHYAA